MVIFGALGPGTLDLDGDSIVTYWVAGISHHKSTREPGRKMNWGKHGLTPPCLGKKKSVFESRGASCLFLHCGSFRVGCLVDGRLSADLTSLLGNDQMVAWNHAQVCLVVLTMTIARGLPVTQAALQADHTHRHWSYPLTWLRWPTKKSTGEFPSFFRLKWPLRWRIPNFRSQISFCWPCSAHKLSGVTRQPSNSWTHSFPLCIGTVHLYWVKCSYGCLNQSFSEFFNIPLKYQRWQEKSGRKPRCAQLPLGFAAPTFPVRQVWFRP